MALISMGVYVFKAGTLAESLIKNCDGAFGYDFGHHVIPSLIGSARVYAYDFRDEAMDSPCYWRDIGTIDSYYDANMDLARSNASFAAYPDKASQSQRRPPSDTGACVSGSARVLRSVLSPGVCVEEDASIEDSVLMPGVRVGRGTRIRRAIVEEGLRIPADFRAGWNIEQDRKNLTVSPTGVVVVSNTPKTSKTVFLPSTNGKTILGFKPTERYRVARTVA